MNQKPEKIYDRIGITYNCTRSADPLIVKNIEKLLNCSLNASLIDVGAGTGNYSYELAKKGYIVHAVEPSELMQKQRKNHPSLKWCYGVAENLPFKDVSHDGALVTLAIHHFRSISESIKEISRILKKESRLVIFSADPYIAQTNNWFKEYFKDLFSRAFKTYPGKDFLKSILEKIFKNRAEFYPFYLPDNLKDGFFNSAWKYPERYLDEQFRNGISIFSKVKKNQYIHMIQRLKMDLENGEWDKKFGYIRHSKKFDGGYFFLTVKKNRSTG